MVGDVVSSLFLALVGGRGRVVHRRFNAVDGVRALDGGKCEPIFSISAGTPTEDMWSAKARTTALSSRPFTVFSSGGSSAAAANGDANLNCGGSATCSASSSSRGGAATSGNGNLLPPARAARRLNSSRPTAERKSRAPPALLRCGEGPRTRSPPPAALTCGDALILWHRPTMRAFIILRPRPRQQASGLRGLTLTTESSAAASAQQTRACGIAKVSLRRLHLRLRSTACCSFCRITRFVLYRLRIIRSVSAAPCSTRL